MNIFFLDHNPYEAAHFLCDKHIPKMLLESVQMLSTLAHETGRGCEHLYKPSYVNHPCNIWLRETIFAEAWLSAHTTALCLEYNYRYKKQHKSKEVYLHYLSHACYTEPHFKQRPMNWTRELLQQMNPPQCMPEKYHVTHDPISAYRRYYLGEKLHFAKWQKGREIPSWIHQPLLQIKD